MKNFLIDPDIRRAHTLSSEFYREEKYFHESMEKIFARTWQYVDDTDNVRLGGQLYPHTLLKGFLDEPVLFSRDRDDKLHCFSNVCTHRGNILVENPCVEQGIRCRYHGRKFKLNGEFQLMPEFEGAENFPSEKDNLPKVPFAQWERFLFASLRPSISFDAVISEMRSRIAFLPLRDFKPDPVHSRDYLVKAHWALYCENYLEGFHIPFVHNSLNKLLDYGSYTTEIYNYSNLQLGIARSGEDCFEIPETSPDFGREVAAYYFWIFPNMMFNFYPWGLSVNIVRPLSPDLTRVSFITYIYDEKKFGRGAAEMIDKVEREDEAVVENVQKGIRSRFYESGRYSPSREQGTHHFHRLITAFMNEK
jgi:choline monooxygenase